MKKLFLLMTTFGLFAIACKKSDTPETVTPPDPEANTFVKSASNERYTWTYAYNEDKMISKLTQETHPQGNNLPWTKYFNYDKGHLTAINYSSANSAQFPFMLSVYEGDKIVRANIYSDSDIEHLGSYDSIIYNATGKMSAVYYIDLNYGLTRVDSLIWENGNVVKKYVFAAAYFDEPWMIYDYTYDTKHNYLSKIQPLLFSTLRYDVLDLFNLNANNVLTEVATFFSGQIYSSTTRSYIYNEKDFPAQINTTAKIIDGEETITTTDITYY